MRMVFTEYTLNHKERTFSTVLCDWIVKLFWKRLQKLLMDSVLPNKLCSNHLIQLNFISQKENNVNNNAHRQKKHRLRTVWRATLTDAVRKGCSFLPRNSCVSSNACNGTWLAIRKSVRRIASSFAAIAGDVVQWAASCTMVCALERYRHFSPRRFHYLNFFELNRNSFVLV